jgi:hypothetical protein
MSNPLFDQFGNKGGNDFMNQFNQFKKNFSGNPQQMIQQMLNSGKITQDQLNQAMQRANQLMKLMK